MKRTSWISSLAALLVVSAGSYALYLASAGRELPAGIVYGNGHIEAREIRVASEVAGRISELLLEEGDRIEAGSVVARIDPEAGLDRLRAARAEARAYRELAASLSGQIDTWEHHLEVANRQLERVRELATSNAASRRDIEVAENGVAEARAQLTTLQQQYAAVEAQAAAAEAKVSLAESQLGKTTVTTPIAGTVLIRAAEEGEILAAGQPIGIVADLDQLELKVYVSGAVLSRIQLGDPAKIRVDGIAATFEARVSRVDDYAQFTPRDVHLPEERIRMVYGVTLSLENPDGRLKPGMPADAWIRWDEQVVWPEPLFVPGT